MFWSYLCFLRNKTHPISFFQPQSDHTKKAFYISTSTLITNIYSTIRLSSNPLNLLINSLITAHHYLQWKLISSSQNIRILKILKLHFIIYLLFYNYASCYSNHNILPLIRFFIFIFSFKPFNILFLLAIFNYT